MEYNYDANGNLTSVTQGLDTWLYTYNTGSWKDQLTSFNGKNIVYDGVGNPLFHDGKTFSWQRGRQLAGITGEEENISYQYNAAGLRTSKTVNGVTTNYLYSGDMLMRQQTGEDVLDFAYDANRKIVGFNRNGVPYYYLRNLQNDVVAIVDADGAIVAQYEYDAWGKPFVSIDIRTSVQLRRVLLEMINLGLSGGEIDTLASGIVALDMMDLEPMWSLCEAMEWDAQEVETLLQGMKGPYILEPTAELINFIFTLPVASPQELEEGGPMYVHFAGVLDSLSQFIDGLGLDLPDLELDLGSPATELAVYILVYEFVFSLLLLLPLNEPFTLIFELLDLGLDALDFFYGCSWHGDKFLSDFYAIRKNFLTYWGRHATILVEGRNAPELAYRRRI